MAAPRTEAPEIAIRPLPADFDRWRELLDLIMAAFAHMDGVIDPPSSAHRLTVSSLRRKCATERVFVAFAGARLAGRMFLDRDDRVHAGYTRPTSVTLRKDLADGDGAH